MKIKNTLFTYGAILLALIFWSFSYIWSKIALTQLSVEAVVAGRFLVASTVFLILFNLRGFPRFLKGDFIKMSLVALCFPTVYYLLETSALESISASEAGIIAATLPIFVLILSRIFLKETMTFWAIGGALLSFGGIYLLATGHSSLTVSVDNLRGYIYMILSMVAVFINAVPLLTALLAWALLEESLTESQLVGGGIILFGVLLANGVF